MNTEEMEKKELAACRKLAERHMTGPRDGSDRKAWEHAQDVAEAVEKYGWIHPDDWYFWVCVAWLHDVLEDGDEMTEARLAGELVEEGVAQHRAQAMADSVQVLTKTRGESAAYFARIAASGQWQLALTKLLDRRTNLREGRNVFTRKRWNRYVKETQDHVLPLIACVDEMLRVELLLSITQAMIKPHRHPPGAQGSG